MTTEQLAELRKWAAEVCGYGLLLPTPEDPCGLRAMHWWQPDERIEQACGLLDAVLATLPGQTYEIGGMDGKHYALLVDADWTFREHESRCMAILLAAKAAWDAMQKEPSDGDN